MRISDWSSDVCSSDLAGHRSGAVSRPDAAVVLDTAHTRPAFALPPGSCDCHVHLFGSCDHPCLAADRLYTPGVAAVGDLLAHHQSLGLERMVSVQSTPYDAENRCTLEAAAHTRS